MLVGFVLNSSNIVLHSPLLCTVSRENLGVILILFLYRQSAFILWLSGFFVNLWFSEVWIYINAYHLGIVLAFCFVLFCCIYPAWCSWASWFCGFMADVNLGKSQSLLLQMLLWYFSLFPSHPIMFVMPF